MAQPMHMQPFRFQGPPGDKLGWEQRIVKWADEYLKKLRGGTLAYPHETGAGKPQAQSLRGYLLSVPVLAVLQNSKVDTTYGNSIRLSAESAHTARAIPQQGQAPAVLIWAHSLMTSRYWSASSPCWAASQS